MSPDSKALVSWQQSRLEFSLLMILSQLNSVEGSCVQFDLAKGAACLQTARSLDLDPWTPPPADPSRRAV